MKSLYFLSFLCLSLPLAAQFVPDDSKEIVNQAIPAPDGNFICVGAWADSAVIFNLEQCTDQILWKKIEQIGGVKTEWKDVIATGLGNPYVLTGTDWDGNNQPNALIRTLNFDGSTGGTTTIIFSANTESNAVLQVGSEFVIAGHQDSIPNIKFLDAGITLLRDSVYTWANTDTLGVIYDLATNGTEIAFTGMIREISTGNQSIMMGEVDAIQGNLLWRKYFAVNPTKRNIGYAVQYSQTLDSLIIAGTMYTTLSQQNDAALLRVDLNTLNISGVGYGGAFDDVAYSLQPVSNGGWLLSGQKGEDANTWNPDAGWVFRLNNNFTITGGNSYTISAYNQLFRSVINENNDGSEFLAAGGIELGNWGEISIIRNNLSNCGDSSQMIINRPGGGIIITPDDVNIVMDAILGQCQQSGIPMGDEIALQACLEEEVVSISPPSSNLRIYPNPGNNSLHVQGLTQNSRIFIRDLQGKLLLQTNLENESATVSTRNLLQGTYLLEIVSEKGFYRGVWIKE